MTEQQLISLIAAILANGAVASGDNMDPEKACEKAIDFIINGEMAFNEFRKD